MANVLVNSIARTGGKSTLKGKTAAGARVTIKHGETLLGHTLANNDGDWEITFTHPPGRSEVEVNGGDRSVIVNLNTGVVTTAGGTATLAVE